MRSVGAVLACLMAVSLASPAAAHELAPGGTLRAVFIATNPVQAVTDPQSGEVRGPAADLGRELARRIGLPFVIKGARGVQGVIDSVKNGEADIGFVAFDPVRAAQVEFSQPYALAQNTYLVLDGSPIRAVADVDRPGVRIVVGQNDAGDYFLTRTLKHAELRRNPPGDGEAPIRLLIAREVDAYAANRQRLTQIAARTAGVRLVPDNFYGVEQAIIVAKERKAQVTLIDQFIDEARSAGLIAGAIARAGLAGVDVAPPRKP